ncbi:MAG: glycosyltransferase family 2 protein [Raoultibacter sp.]
MDKKKISICIGTFNEEGNVENAYERVTAVMQALPAYDYEILFSDNDSQDNTRPLIRELAAKDKRVKAIFNSRNFGSGRSGRNMINNSTGDGVVVMPCDLQDPPEMIPDFVKYWEEGYPVVMGQKAESKNNAFDRFLRKTYYAIIDYFSEVPQVKQVTGFGLFDRCVIDELARTNDTETSMRHLIADLGYRTKLLPYTQAKRTAGKSSYNLYRFVDFGIMSLCSTSRKPLFMMTMLGCIASCISFLIGIVYLVYKLVFWDSFVAGSTPVLIGVFFLGSVQLFCLGLIGEYIGIISERLKSSVRPLVTEDERINFDSESFSVISRCDKEKSDASAC